jgi:signal transduction histidine kinase
MVAVSLAEVIAPTSDFCRPDDDFASSHRRTISHPKEGRRAEYFDSRVRRMKVSRGLLEKIRKVNSRIVDVVVGIAIIAIAVNSALTTKSAGVLTVAAAFVFGASVMIRRPYPVGGTIAVGVGTFVFNRTGGDPNLAVQPLAIVLASYMLGRHSVNRGWSWVDALLLAVAIPLVAFTPGNGSVNVVATVWMLFMVAPFAIGRLVGSHGARAQELRAESDQLAREQSASAERVAWEERNRIARELHDVVAHSVSVMVIQTQAARLVAADDLAAARAAMRAVEDCGRDALRDVRRMIGVLHRGELELATPGLGQLHVLVDRAQAAGLTVDLCIEGLPYLLSPPVDLTAFRVVQEALTNAIKHASPARAMIRVMFNAGALELEITDTGRVSTTDEALGETSGRGLVGMRERVALYGGELLAGRQQTGGFRVHARIPLPEGLRA